MRSSGWVQPGERRHGKGGPIAERLNTQRQRFGRDSTTPVVGFQFGCGSPGFNRMTGFTRSYAHSRPPAS